MAGMITPIQRPLAQENPRVSCQNQRASARPTRRGSAVTWSWRIMRMPSQGLGCHVEILSDPLVLSRLQFALTAMFHILWPVLTIGLSLFVALVEARWVLRGDPAYYHQARFWSKLLLLNFGVGVVTGIPLEFEFGTNWSRFSVRRHCSW